VQDEGLGEQRAEGGARVHTGERGGAGEEAEEGPAAVLVEVLEHPGVIFLGVGWGGVGLGWGAV